MLNALEQVTKEGKKWQWGLGIETRKTKTRRRRTKENQRRELHRLMMMVYHEPKIMINSVL